MMISMLPYKAARPGGWFAVIDARNTSQDCSECGRTVPKDLSVRIRKMRVLPESRSTATSTRRRTF
jgi:transposase